jgi:transmembrane sensor
VRFDIRHDAARPFLLEIPPGRIEVVGTKFGVDIHEQEAEVEVFEGRVRIIGRAGHGPVDVLAGQKTRITHDGVIEHPQHVFQRRLLAEVAAIYNGRAAKPLFNVQGTACTHLISGTLDVDNPQTLLNFLRDNPGFVVTARAQTVEIRASTDVAPFSPCSSALKR